MGVPAPTATVPTGSGQDPALKVRATSTSSSTPHCTPLSLPSHGVLKINDTYSITLSQNAVFSPECTGTPMQFTPEGSTVISTVADLSNPFYASAIPQAYAVAATTVLSYMLFVMLIISPRAVYSSGAGRNGGGFTSQGGVISMAAPNVTIVGVGVRPWLQKVATLTVVISLTIAIAEMTRILEKQYETGYMNAETVRKEVADGLVMKIVRLISDALLWLAQVQTLIRLFPRHREKVIIKWAGFCMIFLETLFAILNYSLSNSPLQPASFEDAVPALTYLFKLALSLLYACCVFYYSLAKRRLAFYHPQEKNICIVAILALCSVVIPIVFFVLDISKPDLAGWGDYVRWVGAAAASVVVWEWVERIEGLEREERKDGVLGREVFDGDEMLEVAPSDELHFYRQNRHSRRGGDDDDGRGHPSSRTADASLGREESHTYRRSVTVRTTTLGGDDLGNLIPQPGQSHSRRRGLMSALPSRLQHVTHQKEDRVESPIPRSTSATTNTSSGSTVYAVRHHHVVNLTPPIQETPNRQSEIVVNVGHPTSSTNTSNSSEDIARNVSVVDQAAQRDIENEKAENTGEKAEDGHRLSKPDANNEKADENHPK